MIRPNSSSDPILEPLLRDEFAQRLVDYHPPAETLDRIEELRTLANEGTLSDEDRGEYESLIESLDLVAILQSKARATLDQRAS
ncbi:MAG: hypothetical protein ACPGYV_11200 [Phycisphaeraceae bacterium]